MTVQKGKREGIIVLKERIVREILLIRGHKVMLNADLADLYGVTTKRLNEQVKRNQERFPTGFMFQLTKDEKAEVVANCDHLFQRSLDQLVSHRRRGNEMAAVHREIKRADIINTNVG